MQALRFTRYGPPAEVLRLEDVEIPVPGEGEVRVRVHAASINPVEWHFVRGEPLLVRAIAGLRAPKDSKVGGDFAGVVDAVGSGATGFAAGDEVFGVADGALAEFACAKTDRIARKPPHMRFDEAASIGVAGSTALQALRDHAQIQPGQRVLLIGAAGGVGSFAVQIAKALGAEVTGVCSAANLDFVRSLGADHVLDYACETPTGPYDVVLQLAGDETIGRLRRLLEPRGTLVIVGLGVGRDGAHGVVGPLARMAKARILSRKSGKRVKTFIAKIRTEDLETLAQLVTPHVERIYPLAETAAALAVIEGGHVRGKLAVVTLRA